MSRVDMDGVDVPQMREYFTRVLSDTSLNEDNLLLAKKMLHALGTPSDPGEVFEGAAQHDARELIVDSAQYHHFLLINEAHYSSQNRAFTRSLLAPLWAQGYRYLALETLGREDTSLAQRGYPVTNTGYYTKDPVFGNLVRDALALGYTLIRYEADSGYEGTQRDYYQAANIYAQTWQRDSVGKVLIHAGYSHIAELGGDQYDPMGAQLKKMAHQDILTVEQQEMMELSDTSKLHSYYHYVSDHLDFDTPTVLSKDNRIVVDPVNYLAIDIQVYHPVTKYVEGRPSWLFSERSRAYSLLEGFKKYTGHLLQAIPVDEDEAAVPVDQFVIDDADKALVLPVGHYDLRIINCEGTLVGKSSVKAAS